MPRDGEWNQLLDHGLARVAALEPAGQALHGLGGGPHARSGDARSPRCRSVCKCRASWTLMKAMKAGLARSGRPDKGCWPHRQARHRPTHACAHRPHGQSGCNSTGWFVLECEGHICLAVVCGRQSALCGAAPRSAQRYMVVGGREPISHCQRTMLSHARHNTSVQPLQKIQIQRGQHSAERTTRNVQYIMGASSGAALRNTDRQTKSCRTTKPIFSVIRAEDQCPVGTLCPEQKEARCD